MVSKLSLELSEWIISDFIFLREFIVDLNCSLLFIKSKFRSSSFSIGLESNIGSEEY